MRQFCFTADDKTDNDNIINYHEDDNDAQIDRIWHLEVVYVSYLSLFDVGKNVGICPVKSGLSVI